MAVSARLKYLKAWIVAMFCFSFFLFVGSAMAATNVISYSDTLSNSAPDAESNHTIGFTIMTDVSPGGYIEVTPPSGFTILSTSTFAERNVELFVNGTARVSSSTADATYDGVTITTGSPGLIRYTFNSSSGLTSGDELELRIGNNTTVSNDFSVSFSTTTGTTTVAADIEPITNSTVLGRHDVRVEVYDGGLVAEAEPIIFLLETVGVGPIDTRESIPPFRFNPAPTSTVGGTTLSVEISLETNEFSTCRYSLTENTSFGSMANNFNQTLAIFHSTIVSVTPDSVQRFYVRCIDDEGNINTDDFLIIFTVSDTPAGTANDEGDVSGDGTGSGNDGTGVGEGGGGEQGSADGITPATGGSSGGGGSGGGSGGEVGEDDEDESGGGFEISDNAYQSGDGEVIIRGYAFPNSRIVILVDGVAADDTTSNNSGEYSITLEEIARGVYTFGVFGVDPNGVQSSVFSTSFTVTGARTTSLSNVNVMPSILVEPDPVQIGETLTITGYTIPNATVSIENQKDGVSQSLRDFSAISDSDGEWSISVETDNFSDGTYKVRALAEQEDGENTNFSNYTFYTVGEGDGGELNADLNRDGSVDLIDFSILLFWWGGDGGDSNPPADINRDGSVSLTDFSILLFQWTG